MKNTLKLAIIVFTILFSRLNEAFAFIARDESFNSNILPEKNGRKSLVQYRVFSNSSFENIENYKVVYFLHGRNGTRFDLEKLGLADRLNELAQEHSNINYIIIAPECGACYWMNAALIDERWGDVVTHELIDDVQKKFHVSSNPQDRIIAGISMGGHGAIQLALNYPEIFGAVAAHSPVFRTQEEVLRDFKNQFGTGTSFQNRDPFSLILFNGKKIQVPIWIDIGALDFAFANTRNFANLVIQQGYQGELHIGEDIIGGHHTEYWKYHLGSYLRWYANQNISTHSK